MRRLAIDFAPPSMWAVVAQTRTATWILGCLGLLAFIGAVFHMVALLRQQDILQGELRKAQTMLTAPDAHQGRRNGPLISEARANAVNKAIAQLNLPWGALLDAVEAASSSTIAVLSLEPDAKKRLLRGSAEAKTSDDLIAYLER